MNTPIVDFVEKNNNERFIRFHMPGHKGKPYLGCEAMDITEIKGSDSLYEADGIIAQSEANASSLFGFGNTFYSTEGSSQCIRAMLYLALLNGKQNGNHNNIILAARNVHKAFIHACALLDLSPLWLYPSDEDLSLCQCTLTPMQIDKALQNMTTKPFALYITAPDYFGYSPNIKEIAGVCEKYNVSLLVDNAHGAYLKFLQPSRHPIDEGAFMCCDSAHKTLPVLTGGAYLQLSSKVPSNIVAQAKNALSLFGSTSPSYLILQSLDLCNKYIANGYAQKLQNCIKSINETKNKLTKHGWNIGNSDPLKIVIKTISMGYYGEEVATILRTNKIECEFADFDAVVLMVTPENDCEQLNILVKVLQLPKKQAITTHCSYISSQNTRKMSIREAFLSVHEIIDIEKAVGRICAAPTVSCPPAIPIVISGEIITEDNIKSFLSYNIKQIEAVKE